MNLSRQVVIVGGGMSAFTAALEIVEAGGEALILEKMPTTGGSAVLSGGCLAFAGTDLQERWNVKDSDELLFKDLREVGEFENDESIVQVYVDNQLSTYNWLRDHGVEFSPALETSSGMSVPRLHTVDPAEMIRRLEAICRASGKVEIILNAAAKRLLRNPETGRVDTVVFEKDGKECTATATDGVLLATGGFALNRELVHQFVPLYDNAVFVSGPGNVGDGLKMAWQLGANFRDMINVKGTYGKHPTDHRNNHTCLFVYKGAIAVNDNAKRYVNESISYKLLADECMRQPYGATYQILDQDIFEQGENQCRILDFERRYEDGLLLKAPTLEKLAEMIEVPADTLVETVNRYNGFVRSGKDEEFGRTNLVHHHGELRTIERGPFYAYPSTACVFSTYCGLVINDRMEVIDVMGEKIDGLFAAGEIVGGFHGIAYMTGTSLGKAAIFGRVAARSILGIGNAVAASRTETASVAL